MVRCCAISDDLLEGIQTFDGEVVVWWGGGGGVVVLWWEGVSVCREVVMLWGDGSVVRR